MSICLISAQIPRQSSPPRRQSATKSAAATRKEKIVCGLKKRCLKVAGAWDGGFVVPSAASLGSISGEEVVGSMTLSHVSRMNYLLIIPNAPQSPLTARRVCAAAAKVELIAQLQGRNHRLWAGKLRLQEDTLNGSPCSLPGTLASLMCSPSSSLPAHLAPFKTMHLAASFEHRYTTKEA